MAQKVSDPAGRSPASLASPEYIDADDMDWSRTNPCDDCPFLKGTPFHEGVAGSLPEKLQAIQHGEFAHSCHKTDNRPSCDGPRNYPGKAQHCAGAILMLLKTGRGMDLQLPLLRAAERGDLDVATMTAKAHARTDIYTLWEFLRFYDSGIEALLRDIDQGGPNGAEGD